jgi:hypothetical protein
LIILAAVVVVVLIAGGVAFALTRGGSSPTAAKRSAASASSTGDFGNFGNGAPTAGSSDTGGATGNPSDSGGPTDNPSDSGGPTDNPSDSGGPTDQPTGTTAAADGPTEAASKSVVTAYVAAANAKNRTAGAALICAVARSDWSQNNTDFDYTWALGSYRGVSSYDSETTVVAYSVTLTKGGHAETDNIDFAIVTDPDGPKLCGEELA